MDGDARPAAPDLASIEAGLQAWRAQGADRADPLRFDRIATLAARARRHDGQARRLLEARLAMLVAAYADRLDARGDAGGAAGAGDAPVRSHGPLGDLLQRMDRADSTPAAEADGTHAVPAPMPALEDARRLWTRLRTRSQVRQSLELPPAGAGPLNSGVLVHRAISLMGTLAPGYLHHFIAYVDVLSALERLREDQAPASTRTGAPQGAARPARSRARKPRR